MDKFFDTLGVVAQAASPAAEAATIGICAAAVVVAGVALAWALPRLGKMLHVPQYKRRPTTYLGTPAE